MQGEEYSLLSSLGFLLSESHQRHRWQFGVDPNAAAGNNSSFVALRERKLGNQTVKSECRKKAQILNRKRTWTTQCWWACAVLRTQLNVAPSCGVSHVASPRPAGPPRGSFAGTHFLHQQSQKPNRKITRKITRKAYRAIWPHGCSPDK